MVALLLHVFAASVEFVVTVIRGAGGQIRQFLAPLQVFFSCSSSRLCELDS